MKFHRIKQLLKYGILHSKEVRILSGKHLLFQIKVFIDMLYCYKKYKMWTNQYLYEDFYKKDKADREKVGNEYLNKGIIRDRWQKEFNNNRKFLNKYTQKKYELPLLREKRQLAYKKRYNMGEGGIVEYNVELTRQHYLEGTIKIGSNVLLAKNVNIDYSGSIVIGDDVQITDGVKILTHDHLTHRDFITDSNLKNNNISSNLEINNNVVVGSKAIILSSCSYIGKFARIGAGAVVTKDVPDYSVVVGIPAKVIKQKKEKNILGNKL